MAFTGGSLVSKLREALSEAKMRESCATGPPTALTLALGGIGNSDGTKPDSRSPLPAASRKDDGASGGRNGDRGTASLAVENNGQSVMQEVNEVDGWGKKGGVKGRGKNSAVASGHRLAEVCPLAEPNDLREAHPSTQGWWRRILAQKKANDIHMSALHQSFLSAHLGSIIAQLQSGRLAGQGGVDGDAVMRSLDLQGSLVEREREQGREWESEGGWGRDNDSEAEQPESILSNDAVLTVESHALWRQAQQRQQIQDSSQSDDVQRIPQKHHPHHHDGLASRPQQEQQQEQQLQSGQVDQELPEGGKGAQWEQLLLRHLLWLRHCQQQQQQQQQQQEHQQLGADGHGKEKQSCENTLCLPLPGRDMDDTQADTSMHLETYMSHITTGSPSQAAAVTDAGDGWRQASLLPSGQFLQQPSQPVDASQAPASPACLQFGLSSHHHDGDKVGLFPTSPVDAEGVPGVHSQPLQMGDHHPASSPHAPGWSMAEPARACPLPSPLPPFAAASVPRSLQLSAESLHRMGSALHPLSMMEVRALTLALTEAVVGANQVRGANQVSGPLPPICCLHCYVTHNLCVPWYTSWHPWP